VSLPGIRLARPTTAPTLQGLVALLLWSATVALARSAAERLGPLGAACAVYLTAGAFLTAIRLAQRRSLREWRTLPRAYLLGCGGLFALYACALFLALGLAADRRQVLEAGLLNYLWPALTLLLSLPILRHRATAGLVPGTLLALGGVSLVLTHGTGVSWAGLVAGVSSNPACHALAAAAAVAWALYSNLARRWGGPNGEDGVRLFAFGTGLLLGLASLAWPASRDEALRAAAGGWSAPAALEVAGLGLATALAYAFWDAAVRRGNLILVAAASYMTPLLSTLVSCAYLGVRPGAALWAGCLGIVAGSFLSWRSVRPAR
jgi:drug/metabolite transporter (DMT)-like permease